MADKKDILVELLQEVRADQKSHSETLTRVEYDVKRNTDDLEEHMEQTRSVKLLVLAHREEYTQRLNELEEPSKVFVILKKYAIGLGALAGAIAAIIKLISSL